MESGESGDLRKNRGQRIKENKWLFWERESCGTSYGNLRFEKGERGDDWSLESEW
jgi:hypothetical protein